MILQIELLAHSSRTIQRMYRYGKVQVLEKKGNYIRIQLEPQDKRRALIALKMLHYHGYLTLIACKP